MQTDPECIEFPGSFVDPSISKERVFFITRTKELLENKKVEEIKSFGDKQPEKFLPYSHIQKVGTVIQIYRSMAQVIRSWNFRANKPEDKWSIHKNGLIALLHYYVNIVSTSRLDNLIHINYEQLFFENYENELDTIFTALDVPSSNFNFTEFTQRIYNRSSKRTDALETLSAAEKDIFDQMQIAKFEEEFSQAESQEERVKLWRNFATLLQDDRESILNNIVDSIWVVGDKEAAGFLNGVARSFANRMTINDYQLMFSDNADWYDKKKPFFSQLHGRLLQVQKS